MSYSISKNSKLVNLVENNNMDSIIILLSAIVSINVFTFYCNSFLGSSVMYFNILHGLLVLLSFILFGNKKMKSVFKIVAIYVFLEYYARDLSSNIKMVLDIVNSRFTTLFNVFLDNKLYMDFSMIIQQILVLAVLCLLIKFVFVFFKKGEVTSLEENNDVKTLFKSFTHIFLIKNENYGFRYNAIP